MVNRGDICWVDHPQAGRRPVCVITRQDAIPVLTNVTVAIVTSTARDIRSEVQLTRADGMPRACVITLDNLFTIRRSSLSRPITRLSSTKLHAVCRALDFANGCG